MRHASSYAGAAAALVKRDALIFASYRTRFVTQFLNAAFTLTLFYFVSRLVRVQPFGSPDDYYAFAVVGLVILQVITATLLTTSSTVRQELVAGTFERLVVSPFGAIGGILAMTVFPVVMALVTGIAMLTFAGLVFGLPIEPLTAPLAIPVGLLGALSFAPFALLVGAAVLAFKQAVSGVGYLLAGFAIVAGVYFPVSLLPEWIRWASDVQPFTPAVDLMRHLLVGTELKESAWWELARLAGFAAVLLPPAVWTLSRALRFGQRRGTITEY